MKINNTLTFGILFSILAVSSTAISKPVQTTNSAETSEAGAVLFRVENIKPIKNQDNLIDKCSYVLTAYNRMDKTLKNADLTLTWTDNIDAKYVISDGEVKTNSKEKSKTIVESKIVISDIEPHKQKSFEQTVETDKCFLLLDNLTYKVNTCITDSDKVLMKDSKVVSKGDCLNNFNYINSQNPEYYSEFKDVPDSVLEKQAEEEKQAELKKINEQQSKISKNLKDSIETLGKIE